MTLAELASYVTTKTQMVEADDVSAAKTFLSKRYELIYNSYLWKDALTMVTLNLDPSADANVANGIVLLPTQIDRVVAMRNNTTPMQAQNLEEIYVDNFSTFLNDNSPLNSYGMLQRFNVLNPVWFALNPVTPQFRLLQTLNGEATSNAVPCVPSDVFAYQNSLSSFDTGFLMQGNTILYGVSSGYTGCIQTNAISTGSVLRQSIALIGSFYGFLNADSAKISTVGSSMTITSDNMNDLVGGSNPVSIKVTWRDATDIYVVTGTLPMTLASKDGSGYIEVQSVFKPVTAGNITFTIHNTIASISNSPSQPASYVVDGLVGTLAPSDTKSTAYQRVRLSVKPATGTTTTLYVLGKKPFTPLDFDNEVPAIKNLDNCLIAFACADMWERARQFNKSNAKLQEGATLLAELAKIETIQQANHSLMSVANGFGDAVDSRRQWGRIYN